MQSVVRIHCGSAHVAGSKYRYVIASLFVPYRTKNGEMKYRNSGKSTQPRRSRRLCLADARLLAAEERAILIEGYGSLHNQPVLDKVQLDESRVA